MGGVTRRVERLVAAGSGAAALLTAHSLLNLRLLRRPAVPPPAARRPPVSVLLPARDEAARIGPALRAVLAQEGVTFEVLVLDDGSRDGTATVARHVAGGDARVRIMRGEPLPAGWLGKPHACAQLAAAAGGDVLVFLDADVRLEPGGLAATVDLLQRSDADMVSPYPRQVADSPAERLMQPLLQWSWLTFLPLRLAERLGAPTLAAANGQLLACRAGAYRAVGGHGAVRDQVIEDVALARCFKRAGFTVALADGTRIATCRMYHGWAEVREGYAKSLWRAFGSRGAAAAVVALLGLCYWVPPAAALGGAVARRGRLAAVGTTGYLAAVAGRAACARATGGRAADAVAHPVSIGVLTWLLRESWRRRGRGDLSWKGRPVG